MLVEKELRKLVSQLIKEAIATITIGNSEITIHVLDNSRKIYLSSEVYFGGNFIPKSVRACLSHKPQFETGHLHCSLVVDEENFKISLTYLGNLENLKKREFIDLIEEFGWLADEWRHYLDEHDKHDLIHINIPRS